MSINGGMYEEGVVPRYNGILFSHKKVPNNAICRDTDEPIVCHAERGEKGKSINI